ELADHLALAAEDEVVKHGRTHEGAWQRAIERFGNPDAVARKLWWDAMKERVMRDWIHSGIAAVSAIVVVLVAVLVVNSMKQMQTTQVQLIEALKQISKPATPEGETLEILVRRGSKDGPPAAGMEVTITGKMAGDVTAYATYVTNGEGRVNFNPVPQGSYMLELSDPQSGMKAAVSHSLFAGLGSNLTIVAPDYAMSPVTCVLESPLPFPNERVLAHTHIVVEDTIEKVNWWFDLPVLIGNQGCYERPAGDFKSGKDFAPYEVTGPSPEILLPPGKVDRNWIELMFRRANGDMAAIPFSRIGGDGSMNGEPVEPVRSGDKLVWSVLSQEVDAAADWVKLYTHATRWLDKPMNEMWNDTFDKYLLAAIPLTDALSASVNYGDNGQATLTVQPNLEKDGASMVGNSKDAAVFRFPDLAVLQAFPAEAQIWFRSCCVSSGELLGWTGSGWATEIGSTFNLELATTPSTRQGMAEYDVTDMVRNLRAADGAFAGILLRDMRTENNPGYDGIVVSQGTEQQEKGSLPYLLVKSDTPPVDL
ncbi:MAG TPA: permease prefix domain 1-containing protein, partial [Candidatus Bathyarchaeia archaeon]|nr:permease prefix domain 1-containing protein [Candidatus Bathyarchaeia archaeon]